MKVQFSEMQLFTFLWSKLWLYKILLIDFLPVSISPFQALKVYFDSFGIAIRDTESNVPPQKY